MENKRNGKCRLWQMLTVKWQMANEGNGKCRL